MNKKGLTVVELIVSFTLTFAILIFLTQIIINLTKIYNNNGKKTEMLNNQSLISDSINSAFLEKNLNGITNCGNNCYIFSYLNDTETDTLKIEGNILTFGKTVIDLEDASYGNISLDIIYTPTIQTGVNDGIFILTIPINSEIDYNFDIKIVYQFNIENSLIDEYFTN